jgi:hypothetical protein
MTNESMHVDPEFQTFTYGDPTPPKRGLRNLRAGDLLVFYAGMERSDRSQEPALYLAAYFEVETCGLATDLGDELVHREFSNNFHVRHPTVYQDQRDRLVLVRGGNGSRVYTRGHRLGGQVLRDNGSYWQLLSPDMVDIFGTFGGIGSIQRSTPRWVQADKVGAAADYVRSLP